MEAYRSKFTIRKAFAHGEEENVLEDEEARARSEGSHRPVPDLSTSLRGLSFFHPLTYSMLIFDVPSVGIFIACFLFRNVPSI